MRISFAVVFAVLAVACAPAFGQDGQDGRLEQLERRVAEQERQIQQLRSQPAAVTGTGLAHGGGGPGQPIEGKDSRFDWGYNQGFYVRGEAGGFPFEIRPRVRLQTDYRAFGPPVNTAAPNGALDDQFVLRRTRIGFDGDIGVFHFQLEVDPPRGGLPLGDFWFQYQQFDAFKVRFGHFKTPWSYEDGMTSDLYIDTVERSMIIGSGASAAPDFRPGAMILGDFGEGLFRYFVSAQNQADSNTVNSDDPLMCLRVDSSFLPGLLLGTAGVWERQGVKGAVSLPGQTPGFFRWFSPVNVHGWDQRYEVDASFYQGPFWIASEYAWVWEERSGLGGGGGGAPPLITQGAYATIGYKFWGPTGKPSAAPHAVPFKDWVFFSPDIVKVRNGRNVGAELVLRYEWMNIESGKVAHNQPESTAATAINVDGNSARALTLGLNIFMIENVKFMFDWVHIHMDDKARAERINSHSADEFLFRAQLEF